MSFERLRLSDVALTWQFCPLLQNSLERHKNILDSLTGDLILFLCLSLYRYICSQWEQFVNQISNISNVANAECKSIRRKSNINIKEAQGPHRWPDQQQPKLWSNQHNSIRINIYLDNLVQYVLYSDFYPHIFYGK